MTEPGVHVRETPGLLLRLDEMNTQPDDQTNVCSATVPDSEDSEEESSQEEPSITSWSELSIIERVGLNSAQMSEKDLETAFSQIALAFRCDQYTLKQRLQAEEHARNLAEENVQLELSRGRETLEALKGLCLDSRRSKVLQRLELSLDILGGTVERISNTAEVLGAVHQEARVSRAVELMVAHVENLRRRDDRNMAELEEAKKAIQQQNPFRTLIDPSASPEPEDSDSRKRSSHHHSIRRRVSISVIPSKTQETLKDLSNWDTPEGSSSRRPACSCPSPSLSCDCMSSAAMQGDRPLDPDGTLSDALNPERLPSKQPTRNIQNKSSSRDTLRHRHKGKSAVSRKKAEKDQKAKTACRRLPAGLCGSLWRHPLARWLLRCRWVLLCTYLLVLFCVTTLTLFLLDAS